VPTYDYRCEKCGAFELWQSIKEDALTVCPKCGSKAERVLSANVGFVLKGSGFYQNEYKNTSSGASSSSHGSGCGCCSEKASCPSATE
jgi:putative FmdB family regulatory protein